MTIHDILERLSVLQKSSRDYFPKGIFPSYRYHLLLPYSRPDDNVYFTSFILIQLKNNLEHLDAPEIEKAQLIIEKGETGLQNYRNRFGDVTYNFYRSDGYFPNGRFLSKFKKFQPTDDADDTSIAYRAVHHDLGSARKTLSKMRYVSNGKRDRWNRRSLKPYRQFKAYNTWIGTDELYVDLDLCVLANTLSFVAKYGLDLSEEDSQSLAFIEKAILTGDYLSKKWALAAWYPFDTVIFYQLSEMFATRYFSISENVLEKFNADLKEHYRSTSNHLQLIILDICFKNMGINEPSKIEIDIDLSQGRINEWTDNFSYGVIPLLQPFNALVFQKLSGYKLFQLQYRCEAQILSFILQWKILRKKNQS